jgi:hypothetical protein
MYHRKFGMTGIFLLRVPYMAFFGMYVGLFKYSGRRSLSTAWHLGTQFIRGYRAWPLPTPLPHADFTTKPL